MNDTEAYLRSSLESLHAQLSDSTSIEEETRLVKDIADCHEDLARCLFPRNSKVDVETHVQQIREDLSDFCLDWAMVSKRAQKKRQSANAQMLRMRLCPNYVSVDAIRLLGYNDDEEEEEKEDFSLGSSGEMKDDSMVSINGTKGIFETDVVSNQINHDTAMRPSDHANEVCYQLRRLLMEHSYTNVLCKAYLQPYLHVTPNRIFHAATFTAQRWNLPQRRKQPRRRKGGKQKNKNHQQQQKSSLLALDVLVRLFLFGIAVEQKDVEKALGPLALHLLLHDARILSKHPVSPSLLMSEVQIYPISFVDLHLPDSDKNNKDCFFLTDWPVESLRPTKEAVISIGYGALNLLALAGGDTPIQGGRLLDVCCGSGIQGIWQALTAKDGTYTDLVLSDRNPRACRFACANLTLNPMSSMKSITIYEGDLYESLPKHESLFSKIICNLPVVALPTADASLNESALFVERLADDTGGTDLLQRIIEEAPLKPDGGIMMLVTELPNIEDSCELLESYCAPSRTTENAETTANITRIRVAYIAKGVETVEQYTDRLWEDSNATLEENKCEDAWFNMRQKAGIRNRALALLALQTSAATNEDRKISSSLHRYNGDPKKKNKQKIVDERHPAEDEFLTRKGMKFIRRHLLKFPLPA